MKEKWNYVIYLLWFSYLVLSALLMFGQGFLLSRKTLDDISECASFSEFGCDGQMIKQDDARDKCSVETIKQQVAVNPGSPLACVAGYRHRVLVILVDALRYDFTLYDPSIKKPAHYQNRLPVIKDMQDQYPNSTRLYRFMADPPTTTLQRVKSLVTGSLPTFIDLSANFAAEELHEDTLVDQVVRGGGKVVLLGDDTWARLLPKRWLRSHALYSFHTWDLDTVDNEVDSKIFDELKKDDWDLLLAHYLGIDHAGHRYGPLHPEMSRKLDETNRRIAKIIKELPSDVTLYIIGDHGMTETDWLNGTDDGDHGGETKTERTAAFFAYRKAGLFPDEGEQGREVQQTDFAPTLCAAFGRPPPAPSLGSVLLPVLPEMPLTDTLVLLTNNLKQIISYLLNYGDKSQQIPVEKLAHYINATRDQIYKARSVETKSQLQKYATEVKEVLNNLRLGLSEIWVVFDSLAMLRALLLLSLVIFFNWLMTEGLPVDRIPNIFASSFIPTALICMGSCAGICYALLYMEVLKNVYHAIYLSTGIVSGLLICSLVIMHWDGITQRWYEGRSVFHERFSRTAIAASAVVLVSNSFIIEEGASLSFLTLSVLAAIAWNVRTVKALILWGCFGVALGLTRQYRGCREEQGECWTSGNAMTPVQDSRAVLVLALGSVSAVVAVARRHVGWYGYGVVLSGLLTCAHWAVGWGTLGSANRSKLLARCAWMVLVVMFALIWRRDGRGPAMPLAVFVLIAFVANALTHGAAYAPSVALSVVAGFLALNLISITKKDAIPKLVFSSRCSTSVACMWALLASYMFYGTGHHPTLSHIRWAPAFHAGDPNYLPLPWLVTGVLISLDLWGMPFMFGLAVPLLALWGSNNSGVGPRTQLASVFSLCLKFGLCFAIRSFMTALSATIHCRHLMVWGVFAPKFMFESSACAAALLGTALSATLTAWHWPQNTKSS